MRVCARNCFLPYSIFHFLWFCLFFGVYRLFTAYLVFICRLLALLSLRVFSFLCCPLSLPLQPCWVCPWPDFLCALFRSHIDQLTSATMPLRHGWLLAFLGLLFGGSCIFLVLGKRQLAFVHNLFFCDCRCFLPCFAHLMLLVLLMFHIR
jgi:hypothetical protein